MTNRELVQEISRLPLWEKMSIVEIILNEINNEAENGQELAKAAEALISDYENDAELVAFTSLDSDNFYETK